MLFKPMIYLEISPVALSSRCSMGLYGDAL
jgi:hypothetical protein